LEGKKMKADFRLYGDILLGPADYDFKASLLKLDIWNNDELEYINSCSNDDLASEHYSTFGMTVFPYGHYYTSSGRNFGGDHDDAIISYYLTKNFDYNNASYGLGPNHLGTQLKFIKCLLEKNELHATRYFVANFVLNWIHGLSTSLNEMNGVIFRKLVKFVEKECIELWKGLNGPDHMDEIEFALIGFDYKKDLLENEKTSLKDIGETLMTPALCGGFISKPTLMNFAHKLDIPTGFGSRVMMMETIFKEAINYEKIDSLLSMFDSYLSHWESSYGEFEIEPISKVWTDRIHQAKSIVNELRTSAR
jgi:hypothetical protein